MPICRSIYECLRSQSLFPRIKPWLTVHLSQRWCSTEWIVKTLNLRVPELLFALYYDMFEGSFWRIQCINYYTVTGQLQCISINFYKRLVVNYVAVRHSLCIIPVLNLNMPTTNIWVWSNLPKYIALWNLSIRDFCHYLVYRVGNQWTDSNNDEISKSQVYAWNFEPEANQMN